jgi:hypothetical protein
MRASAFSCSEDDSNPVVFRINSLDFEASNFPSSAVLLRVLAIFYLKTSKMKAAVYQADFLPGSF